MNQITTRLRLIPLRPVILLTLLIILASLTAYVHTTHQRLARQRADRIAHLRLSPPLQQEALRRIEQLAATPPPILLHPDHPLLQHTERTRPNGITTISSVTDLNRYADLNNLVLPNAPNLTATAERWLTDLLIACGDFTPIPRLEALRDWIAPTDESHRGTPYYQTLTPPYRTADTWLRSWHDLTWIDGFNAPDYFTPEPHYSRNRAFSATLYDHLTVLPGPRTTPHPLNINTAAPVTLQTLFGPGRESLTAYILLNRRETPIADLPSLLDRFPHLDIDPLRPFLSTTSRFYAIHVAAFAPHQHTAHRTALRAVVEQTPTGAIRIWSWTRARA